MSQIDYVSLEQGKLGLISSEGFERYSERHYVTLAPEGMMPVTLDYVRQRAPHVDMILALENGLPAANEMEIARTTLGAGRRVFFHWPHENALEVVTPERLASFALHRKAFNLYWRWRALRKGMQQWRGDRRLMRTYKPAAPNPPPPEPAGGAPPRPPMEFLSDLGDRLVA